MSIEKRLSPFLRSVRTLIKQHPDKQRHIKDLQTLGPARDRPSPYGSRRDFLCPTVARGPVSRDCSIQTKNACSTEAMDVF